VKVYNGSEALFSDLADHAQTRSQAAAALAGLTLETYGMNIGIGGIESSVGGLDQRGDLEVRAVALECSEIGRVEDRFAEIAKTNEENA